MIDHFHFLAFIHFNSFSCWAISPVILLCPVSRSLLYFINPLWNWKLKKFKKLHLKSFLCTKPSLNCPCLWSKKCHSLLYYYNAFKVGEYGDVLLIKAAHQSTFFNSHTTTFTTSVLFVLKLDNPILFVTMADSILSSCLSTCPVWLKWARMDRRKDEAQGIRLQLLKYAWETAKRDRLNKLGQKRAHWIVCAWCVGVYLGGSKDGRCQQFSFSSPSPFA